MKRKPLRSVHCTMSKPTKSLIGESLMKVIAEPSELTKTFPRCVVLTKEHPGPGGELLVMILARKAIRHHVPQFGLRAIRPSERESVNRRKRILHLIRTCIIRRHSNHPASERARPIKKVYPGPHVVIRSEN